MCVVLVFAGFLPSSAQQAKRNANSDYIAALKQVTDVMVNDVTSPVAASRYYAYITLAAYEVQAQGADSTRSFSGKLNGFRYNRYPDLKDAEKDVASIWIVYKAGSRLLPSGYLVRPYEDSLVRVLSSRLDTVRLNATRTLVDQVLNVVLAWAKADGFSKINNLVRYTPLTGDGYWQPTAPVFMAPVEPHWNTIRPFVLKSANQFPVTAPAPYSTADTSSFFLQMKEVYDVSRDKDTTKQHIAMFWDCNPFSVQQLGHVEFGLKKISPGGHWIGITGIACKQKHLPLRETTLIHALVSFGLADAFIACWDEKYKSNRIRPETAINRLMDRSWRPLLQTPPFPEYVSGHSVASTAASLILTAVFGDNFNYVDDTEVEFELPERRFGSFREAAKEACISRLYGGIHFRDAIDFGVVMGEQVAGWTISQLAPFVSLAIAPAEPAKPIAAKRKRSR
jgi:hypothetical protein